jgi:hypothetical protein
VDATRTVALAAGPWVKRSEVVSSRYDQLSMLRTIEILLGLDPINMNDAMAVPMFDIFDKSPKNLDPYNLPQLENGDPAPTNKLVENDQNKYKELYIGMMNEKAPVKAGKE